MSHARWLFSTSASRLVAAWIVALAFLYLTGWSVWTFIALVDIAQVLGRSQQRAQRFLGWATDQISRCGTSRNTHPLD